MAATFLEVGREEVWNGLGEALVIHTKKYVNYRKCMY
jgi:hypothetical protein